MKLTGVLCSTAALCLAHVLAGGQTDGLGARVPNTSIKMPGALPTFGFTTTNAFPGLSFNSPVAIRAAPGELNRLFIVEKTGRIMVITNLAQPTASVFLDLTHRTYAVDEGGLLSLAFHPGFATNGYFFVYYTLLTNTGAGAGVHDRIARFSLSNSDPNQALDTSEVPLITQIRRGSVHHGGDMHFGPDGYLYVSLGDESGDNDSWKNGQLIDKNFFAAILRIDVDKRPGSLPPNPHPASSENYTIPPDNPFIGATNFNSRPVDPGAIRTEFWAVGFRNPWRMSFDPVTGFLYCGDVGQGAREEIDLVVKGGNYGWPVREGTIAGPETGPPAKAFNDPLFDYGHGGGTNPVPASAVMGGVVYRGQRLSQLTGDYVFADYLYGDIMAFHYDGVAVTGWRRLTSDPGISALGIDPSNGDVLVALYYAKVIKRLVYNSTLSGSPLPATLAETGAFQDLPSLTPNPGIAAYDVNVSFWSDHALKQRWFCVPNTDAVIHAGGDGKWQFPAGTIWIKHFALELTNGVPESTRRLETRFLVLGPRGPYGVTYRWDDTQRNASLVDEAGMDEAFVIQESGILRTQVWHYPGRAECMICHNPIAGSILGFRAEQLNRDFDYGPGGITNQLLALTRAGYFSGELPNPRQVRALALPADAGVSLEYRVRSYLDANCSQCHQPGGLGQNSFDARIGTRTSLSGLINGVLLNPRGDAENRLIKPGDTDHSMIFRRISQPGSERMPPLATRELDREGIDLVERWIATDLVRHPSYAEWQVSSFGSTGLPAAESGADPDGDGASNYLEYLTGTQPTDGKDYWGVTSRRNGGKLQISFEQIANRAFQVQATSDPADAVSWRALDVPGNELSFPAVNHSAVIEDSLTNAASKFYRVEVIEP